jgi:hypothetical protein
VHSSVRPAKTAAQGSYIVETGDRQYAAEPDDRHCRAEVGGEGVEMFQF